MVGARVSTVEDLDCGQASGPRWTPKCAVRWWWLCVVRRAGFWDYGLGREPRQRVRRGGLGREPCFPVRGPRILLQNLQNPGKWPRFSILHQVFKADFSAISLIIARSGSDFVGRDGCFQLRRPTGQFPTDHFHNCNRKERKGYPPLQWVCV